MTAKREPNDVDIFMLMEDGFDETPRVGETRVLFHHESAQIHFGCSVFWMTRAGALGNEQGAVEHWQIKRDLSHRGIVEIIPEEL